MRAIYAVGFDFPEGTDPDQVLNAAGAWISRGDAPEEVRTSWEPGRRSYPLPTAGQTLEVEVLPSDEGTLWHAAWQHPYGNRDDLRVLADVEIGHTADRLSFYMVLRAASVGSMIAPQRFDLRAPRLPRDLITRFAVTDAGHSLMATPTVLDAAAVHTFVDDLLLDPGRTRPVVFAADDSHRMRPNLDVEDLARELAGLAHVYTSMYSRPGHELERRLGSLGCGDGCVRIWWPGMRADDPFGRHPLLTAARLRNQGDSYSVSTIFRRISTAASMNGAPPAHTRLRRAGRRAQIAAGAPDDPELLRLLEEDNERLESELRASEDARLEAELERDALQTEVQQLTEQMEQQTRSYGQALAELGRADEPTEEAAGEPEIPAMHTVRDAVDAAVDRCPHLAFADHAFDTADDSPFERPEDIYDALLRLERLAERWAQPNGMGGVDLAGAARELRLDWKTDLSEIARGRYDNLYSFRWNGEKRVVGPHVRLGSGSGAGKIARIYLYEHEPEQATDRRLVVAHVGKKLPDTTT